MRIFHIATASDWAASAATGDYRTSSLGKSLEEEGFLHASRRDQVAGVFKKYYADKRLRLVLLSIDTDKLTSPWREDPVGDTTFPHIYGPLNRSAVVGVQPLNARGGTQSFFQLFFIEMIQRVGAGLFVMLLSLLGVVLGRGFGDRWAPLLGAALGLAVGVGLLIAYAGWRRRRV